MTQPPISAATPAQPASTHDDSGLAAALARIPSGLFVVTWRDGGVDRGMLASWVMQAGFSPPAVTVAIGRGRDLLPAIDRGETFVVNILGESQRPLLARFGRPAAPGEDPFTGLDLERTTGETAVLGACTGWFACRCVGRVGGDTTDHAVVLAEVITAGVHGAEPPLVHIRKNGLRY